MSKLCVCSVLFFMIQFTAILKKITLIIQNKMTWHCFIGLSKHMWHLTKNMDGGIANQNCS